MPDNTQKDKLDAHIKTMEEKAVALEEQAEYAEKEAVLRKRITEAKDKIAKNKPPLSLFPLPHIPTTNRFAIVLLALIIISFLVVKMC